MKIRFRIILRILAVVFLTAAVASWFYFYIPDQPNPYSYRYVDEVHGDIVERTRDFVEGDRGFEFSRMLQGYDIVPTLETVFPYRWLTLPLAISGIALFIAGWLLHHTKTVQ